MDDKPADPRSSEIPYRLDLAGSWHDQPFVSRHADGTVITLSVLPTHPFDERSGLASSTRQKAVELWGNAFPDDDREKLGRILFCYDNPPGTKDISGSQDALGITLPGLNRLSYSKGAYWPANIESVKREETLLWLETHIRLIGLGPRPPGCDVLEGARIDSGSAGRMALASQACWEAILNHDAPAFGKAMTDSFTAQAGMLPNVLNQEVAQQIEANNKNALGYKLSGAGGGGYLIVVADKDLPGSLRIKVAR